MLPIFLMTGIVVFGTISALSKYPGYLIFVTVLAIFPLTAFLSICAIRAGLVHRRESRGPELAKLVRKSWQLGLIQAGLFAFYVALTLGAVAATLRPASFAEWKELFATLEATNASNFSLLSAIWAMNPALLVGFGGAFFVYCVAYVALSIPFAAHGANAAVNGPKHEFFYGIGRKFLPLFIVLLICLLIYFGLPPVLYALILKSTPVNFAALSENGLWQSGNMPVAMYFGATTLMNFWLWSWYSAATAVAYIDVRDHIEEEHQIAMGSIRASAGPATDLAALMRERSDRLRARATVADLTSVTGAFGDIDEPVQHDQRDADDLFEGMAPVADVSEEVPLVLEPQQELSPEEVEERFRERFGGDNASALRVDLSAALRDAAAMETAPRQRAEDRAAISPENIVPGEITAPLDPEQVPAVEPDAHEAVPENDDAPEWLRKYMGKDADTTIFGPDKK